MTCEKELPKEILAWRMFGAGMENFGEDDKPSVLPMPEIADDELLMKIEAIGLCFSDVKLIRAGEEHPRVISKNLKTNPVIPGHEAVMTVAKVGKSLEGQYKVGDRYIIQADIYVNGVGFAYGYALDGGMAQYSVINQKVLNGDEGCYLLPLADTTPSVAAALFEPWTCVLASRRISHRTSPLAGGRMLFHFGSQDQSLTLGPLVSQAAPVSVTLVNAPENFVQEVTRAYPQAEINCTDALPEKPEFDDIFLCGSGQEDGERAAKLGRNQACISFIGDYKGQNWHFDVGSIHYQGWFYQGTASGNLSEAYGRNVRSELKKDGACWLPGGAGAMGQMHTQLTLTMEDGPSRVLVTDMDDARLAHVREALEPAAKAKGIVFELLNPKNFASPEDFDRKLKEFAPGGFDDIVQLVPVPALVAQNAAYLAEDGLMNIFAGIPAGKEALLPVSGIAGQGIRYIGSSGSTTADLRHTITMVESGSLSPITALAAVGGMNALKEGIEAVADAKFPGKTVIFPNCENMPLTPVSAICTLAEGLDQTLDDDGHATLETEKVLLDCYSN